VGTGAELRASPAGAKETNLENVDEADKTKVASCPNPPICTLHCKSLRNARTKRLQPPVNCSPCCINSPAPHSPFWHPDCTTPPESARTLNLLHPSSRSPKASPRLICACKLRTFL
jgi:hypothetical protein